MFILLDTMGSTNKNIDLAKEFEIQCVPEDFLDEVTVGGAILMITKKNMASWGANVRFLIDFMHYFLSSLIIARG